MDTVRKISLKIISLFCSLSDAFVTTTIVEEATNAIDSYQMKEEEQEKKLPSC
jgi:hypothetical protein